jgi:hypothetical protein
MDRLVENDTWKTTVWLSEQEDSIAFLNYIYPQHFLLPSNKMLADLLDVLVTQGHYSDVTKGKHSTKKWTHYPAVNQKRSSSHEAQLAKFFNGVCVAVHGAYGISCL